MCGVQQEKNFQQVVTLFTLHARVDTYCGMCHVTHGWHLDSNHSAVAALGATGFFMLCDKNTHMYLTLVDMPPSVTTFGTGLGYILERGGCPLAQFCHVNFISCPNVATAMVQPPGFGRIPTQCSVWRFALRNSPDTKFPRTHRRVLWCTLVLPHTPLLDYQVARFYNCSGKTDHKVQLAVA